MEKTEHHQTISPPEHHSEVHEPITKSTLKAAGKFPLIPGLIVGVVVFVGLISGVFVLGSKQLMNHNSKAADSKVTQAGMMGQDTTVVGITDKSQVKREVGNATELYPYGKINKDTIVEMGVSGKSGVIVATLAANINLYLVYPSNLPDGSPMLLTPYYSMPTAKNAVPLSNQLGYGLDIQYEASRHGELPGLMYAVFDLDHGKTIAEIRKNKRLGFFCDPTVPTFNPEACALYNKVPLTQHTNPKYLVVSPIRTEGKQDLSTLEPTIPIGFDNLIVVPISKEATIIPQPFSKELLSDLIKANALSKHISLYTNEAVVDMIDNNLYNPEDISDVTYRLHGSYYFEDIKDYFVLPKFQAVYDKLKKGSGLTPDEQALATKLQNTTFDIKQSIKDNLKDLHLEVSTQFNDINVTADYITGAALIRRLETAGIDMKAERLKFAELLRDNYDYFIEDDPGAVSDLVISAAILSPKVTSIGRASINWTLVPKVYADEDPPPMTPDEAQKLLDDMIKRAQKELNRLCGLDENSYNPPSSVEKGLKFANLIGDEEGAEKCRQKMCSNLDIDLGRNAYSSPQDEAKNYMWYQKYCDDSKEKDDKWKSRTEKAFKKLKCITLIQKGLQNFADNRVWCHEFEDDKGTIDGYKDDKDAIKATLQGGADRSNGHAPIDKDPGAGYNPSGSGDSGDSGDTGDTGNTGDTGDGEGTPTGDGGYTGGGGSPGGLPASRSAR